MVAGNNSPDIKGQKEPNLVFGMAYYAGHMEVMQKQWQKTEMKKWDVKLRQTFARNWATARFCFLQEMYFASSSRKITNQCILYWFTEMMKWTD